MDAQLLPSTVKRYPNKYRGKCDVCGKWVSAYAGLCWKPVGSGNYLVAHETCLMTPAELAAKQAEADALELARQEKEFEREQQLALDRDAREAARTRSGVDFANPISTKTTQGAWQDSTVEVFAFDPACSDEDLKLAFEEPPSSSSGALRWSGGQSVRFIDRINNRVEVFSSVRLCD